MPAPVVPRARVRDEVAGTALLEAGGEVRVEKQLLLHGQLIALAERGIQHGGILIGAEGAVRPAHRTADLRAEVQVLGPADFVLVADLFVFVLQDVEAHEGVREGPVRRQLLGRHRRHRRRNEAVAVVDHSEHQPPDPAVHQAVREPAHEGIGVLVVVELIHDVAEVVARHRAVEGESGQRRASARVQRVERFGDLQQAGAAVAGVGVRRLGRPVRTEYVGIRPGDRVGGAVDGAAARELQGLPEAQDVRVLDVVARGVGSSGTPEGKPGAQGPDILGDHLDVDDSVCVVHGHDVRVVDISEQPQVALGLGQLLGPVPVSACEQQLAPDGGGLRADVQAIGKAEQSGGLSRVALIEDVSNIDVDGADDRPRGLQSLVGGNAGGSRLVDPGVLEVGELRP